MKKHNQPHIVEKVDFDIFIVEWNNKFPLDYWYRKKFKIPFNSLEHRSLSLLTIIYEYREDIVIQRQIDKQEQRKLRAENYLETGLLFDESTLNPISEEELDKWFDTPISEEEE